MVDKLQTNRKKRGRPKGSKTTSPAAVRAALRFIGIKHLQEIPAEHLFAGDAYEFFVCLYKDIRVDIATRMDAAAKAIRHEKPQLMSSTVQHSGTLTLESLITEAIKNPPSE